MIRAPEEKLAQWKFWQRHMIIASGSVTIFVWFLGVIAIIAHSDTLGAIAFLTAGLALVGWLSVLVLTMAISDHAY